MNDLASPNVSRRAFLAGGLSIGAAALVLPACSKAVDQAAKQSSSSPHRGGTLKMVQTADISPPTLLSQNNPNFTICRTVFNTLTEYDHKTLQPKPSLATHWDIRDDGKTYVLTLRDDVKYHSGRPFGPDDVIAVIGLLNRPAVSSQVKAVSAICDASKTGSNEVTLKFSQAVTNVFDMLEMMIMVDHESFGELSAGKSFIGTGPFELKSYRPGTGFRLARNASYWRPGRPYLDEVQMQVVTQSSSALASLQSGQSQLALDLAPLDAAGLRDNPNYQLVLSDANDSTFYIGQNVTVEPLTNPEVRRAIAWAIDRDRVLKQVLGGIGQTSSLPWSKSSPAYDPAKVDTFSFNTAKAKQLLASAGASGATVHIYYNAGLPTNAAIAEIVQFNLTQAGLKAKASPLQAVDFQTRLSGNGLPGLFINGHGFGQMQPATLAKGSYPFNAAKNAEKFSSTQYTKLADKMWTTTDKGAVKAVYDEVNDLLIQQQFVTDLVVSSHTFAISAKLKNLGWTMLDYIDLDDAYLES